MAEEINTFLGKKMPFTKQAWGSSVGAIRRGRLYRRSLGSELS